MKIDNSFLFDTARTLYSDISYSNREGKILTPLRYILEITYRCNLTCPFCYLGHDRQLNELTTDEWKKVIKQIPRYAFVSFLGGEIFVRKDIFEIMEYASKHVFGKINFYTNGTLLTKEKIDELLKTKFLLYSTSLDGVGALHDKIREKDGSYDKTLENLTYVSNKTKKGKTPLTEVKTVVFDENMDDLPKLYKICNENNVDFFSLGFIRTTNIRQNPHLLDEMPESFIKGKYPIKPYFNMEKFEEIYKELESLSKNSHTLLRYAPKFKPHSSIQNFKNIFESGDKDIKELWKPCKFPFGEIFINPEGEVYPCLPIKMGNLKEKKLKDIINGEKFKQFRKKLQEEKVFAPCNLCCDLYPKMDK